jgi:hypothetical protein
MNAVSHRGIAVRDTGRFPSRIVTRGRDGSGVHRLSQGRRGPRLRGGEVLESRQMLSGDPYPYVQSISLVGTPPAFATTRDYAVTFSEPVTGVDPTDFQLALSGTSASLPVSVSGGGAGYMVKVSGITGVGMLGLNLMDNNSIRDLSGNPLVTKDAASSFAPQQSYETGVGPDTAELGDFNLDGTLDIVTTNAGNNYVNTVSVLLGNGDGTFQDQLITTNTVRQAAEAVGDLNADGKPDLVVANATSNTLSVLLGKGDGTFSPPLTLFTGSYPSAVAVGDFDADGRLDIAATNEYSNSVSLFLGNGDGSFQLPHSFAVGSSPAGVAIGDVNADGSPDLAVTNYGGSSVSVLLGNGDGTFQPQKIFATDPWTYRVSIGDVNLDGKLDIVTGNIQYFSSVSNSVSVLLGNGDGTFLPQKTLSAIGNPYSVTQGDINGDGKPDLVVAIAAGFGNTVSMYLGNGDGTYQAAQSFASGGFTPYYASLGDLNGDGRSDVVVANAGSSNVSVFLNTGNGSFTGQTTTVRVGNVYTVTNVSNSGAGSLRQAILNANAHAGPDTIQFAILGANKVITLSSALPTITGVAAIDGSTQAGVSVVGSRVSSAITGLAFAAAASDSYVGGLTISGFKGIGIAATNAKVTLQSNTLTGNKTGISLAVSVNSLIGGPDAAMGNMLSGNKVGIALSGACTGTVVDRNTLYGSSIGVSLANATGVRIGILGNTIAESTSHGVQASGNLAGSAVQGNAITGTTLYGVFLNGAANLLVTGNTITDGKPQGTGLYATGTLTNTFVQGNMIRNNRSSGVLLNNARGITVGLTDSGAGTANTIMNNSGFGLRALGTSTGSAVRKNIISGNYVNVQISAARDLVYVP